MNVKNLILGIGIFIVYMLMLGYGVEAFYPSPEYNDFCKTGNDYSRFKGYIAENCSYSMQIQEAESQCYQQEGMPVYEYNNQGCAISVKDCDLCNKEFNDSIDQHNKIVFVIALIVGLITLVVGYSVLSVEPVGSALLASGIGAIFYGSVRNWNNLSDVLRFLLLVVALVFLIWITLRLNKSNKKSKKK